MSKHELLTIMVMIAFGWFLGFCAGWFVFHTDTVPLENQVAKAKNDNDVLKTEAIRRGIAEIKDGVFRFK